MSPAQLASSAEHDAIGAGLGHGMLLGQLSLDVYLIAEEFKSSPIIADERSLDVAVAQ